MSLDAIIVADCGESSLSVTNALKLHVAGRVADIQTVKNYLQHGGNISLPIEGDRSANWSSAPHLNGLYLLSFLQGKGLDVTLINTYYEQQQDFADQLTKSPKAVIISTTFIYNKETLSGLVDSIRSVAPDITIIAGGPFVYYSYLLLQKSREKGYETEQAHHDFLFLDPLSDPGIDLFIISPQGEDTLLEAMIRLSSGKSFDDLPNTAIKSGEVYEFATIVEEEAVPWSNSIDWRNLPKSFLSSAVVPMQASIGCSFQCTFCNFVKNPRMMSIKPLDQLIADLKAVSECGVRYIWFTDDNFRLGSRDLNAVCQRFIDEGLNIKWLSFIRASALKDVDFNLLARAGCHEVQLGLESADVEILQRMNKEADVAMYANVVRNLLAAGINCSCYFIIGFPGETADSVGRTTDFIKSIEHPDLDGSLSWSIFPFILAPLSPIYGHDLRQKYGLSGYMHRWIHHSMNDQEARKHVKKIFFDLENSGPIYRSDNLDMLQELSPRNRKQFAVIRHRLAKQALEKQLDQTELLRQFGQILNCEKTSSDRSATQNQVLR